MPRIALHLAIALGTLAPSAAAQDFGFRTIVGTEVGEPGTRSLGSRLVPIGDLTGDGVAELIAVRRTGTWYYSTQLIFYNVALQLEYAWQSGEHPFKCDDLDGDGLDDYGWVAVGQTAPAIYLSSSTFQLLRIITLPAISERLVSIGSCDDRDGDGVDDLFIASFDTATMTPWVHFVSPVTGAFLLSLDQVAQTPAPGSPSKCTAIPFDDVDEDGIRDFVFANAMEDAAGVSQAGVVYVRSGTTGALLDSFAGWSPGQRLGWRLMPVGDLDNDGDSELVVDSEWNGATAFLPVRSAGNQQELFQVVLPNGPQYPHPDADPARDFDGDGTPDFLLGRWVVSGMDGRLLMELEEPPGASYNGFGMELARLPRAGADPLLLYADPLAGAASEGAFHVVRIHPGIEAERPTIKLSNPLPLDLHLSFPQDEAGRHYRVLASLGPIGTHVVAGFTIPLAPDPLLRRTAFSSAPGIVNGSGSVPASLQATATLDPASVNLRLLLGRTIRFAVATADAAGPRWSSISIPVSIVP